MRTVSTAQVDAACLEVSIGATPDEVAVLVGTSVPTGDLTADMAAVRNNQAAAAERLLHFSRVIGGRLRHQEH